MSICFFPTPENLLINLKNTLKTYTCGSPSIDWSCRAPCTFCTVWAAVVDTVVPPVLLAQDVAPLALVGLDAALALLAQVAALALLLRKVAVPVAVGLLPLDVELSALHLTVQLEAPLLLE